jgi:hypothetical protein
MSIDIEKTSLPELKKYYQQKYNISDEELKDYNRKSSLIKFVEESFETNNLFDDVETENVEVEQSTLDHNLEITRYDSEWSSWILSHLEDDEKRNDVPTVDGLRRLVEKFIGPILNIDTTVVQAPGEQNGYVSTVKVSVTVFDKENECACAFDATGELQKSETDYPYNKHLTTSAETKAESKAYKRILRLKNICSYEEIQEQTTRNVEEATIMEEQIMYLDTLCGLSGRGLNINIIKLLALVSGKEFPLRRYSSNDASKAIDMLNTFQQDQSSIPAELKGYDFNWKN